MTPDEDRQVRTRQKSRAIVTWVLLGALVILFYAVTSAKIGGGQRWPAFLLRPSTGIAATGGRGSAWRAGALPRRAWDSPRFRSGRTRRREGKGVAGGGDLGGGSQI